MLNICPARRPSATSAYDTVTQCAGVCRDFAHLGIALCRALNIPARYFTGYAYRLDPPDFHACFEAFIGGYWLLFDATKLVAPNALVRIGLGRDATDVSVCTAFRHRQPDQSNGLLRGHRRKLRAPAGQGAGFHGHRPRHHCMSRLRITHTTTYRYSEPVSFGLHRLIVRPREGHDLQVGKI